MKYYNYLLFRIYFALSDPKKGYDKRSINIILVNTSTLILWLFLYTFFLAVNYFFNNFLNLLLPNNKCIVIYLSIIAFLNYYFFIKDKKFLKYDFENDKKGGVITVLMLLLIIISCIAMSTLNRNLKIKREAVLVLKNTRSA